MGGRLTMKRTLALLDVLDTGIAAEREWITAEINTPGAGADRIAAARERDAVLSDAIEARAILWERYRATTDRPAQNSSTPLFE